MTDYRDIPSWEQIKFNSLLILGSKDDPEDSMQFAFTRESFGLVCFGVQLVVRMVPELGDAAERFLTKVYELSDAQDFLDWSQRPDLRAELEEMLGFGDDEEEEDTQGLS